MANCKWSMLELHRKVLIQNRLELAKNLCLDEMLQFLVQENVLSDRMVEKIQYQPTTFSRNVAFLSLLPKRGPKAYESFKKALQASGQSFLVDMLSDVESEMRETAAIGRFHVSNNIEPSPRTPQNDRPNNGLDLRDGQRDGLYVTNTTVEFYKRTHMDAYKMTSKPRGLALVVNVSTFAEGTNLQQREGSDVDQKNLAKLLRQLHVDIRVVENCSAEEMTNALQSFAQDAKHQQADCCMVVILSHGANGFVYGSDGAKVELTDVFRIFDNDRCPSLQNKPKLFLIQACRDMVLDVADGPPVAADNSLAEQFQELGKCTNSDTGRLPTMSDMIIGRASLSGASALRNTRHGSWYIQGFVKMMANHAKDMEITEILTMVNDFVRKKALATNNFQSASKRGIPEFVSTLCKKLYFYPGIVEKSSSTEVVNF